jgi:hypothetical protein
MSLTVESIHSRVLEKISIITDVVKQLLELQDIAVELGHLGMPANTPVVPVINSPPLVIKPSTPVIKPTTSNDSTLQRILLSIKQIDEQYRLSTTELLLNYYSGGVITNEFNRIITNENFNDKLDAILISVTKIAADLFPIITKAVMEGGIEDIINELSVVGGTPKLPLQRDIEQQLAMAGRIKFQNLLEKNTDGVCECGETMNILDEISEYQCSECGITLRIEGIIFRDEQCYTVEGSKTRHNDYTSARHYREWITTIQAKESKEFDEDVLSRIAAVIASDNISLLTLNCKKMREILKDSRVGATNLNNNIPLLVKKFGGTPPPQLTFAQDKFLEVKHAAVMAIYESSVSAGKNVPYCPYFIYKLIGIYFSDNPEVFRLRNYIHLQSKTTVEKHDEIFEKICLLADKEVGLVYVPTDTSGC